MRLNRQKNTKGLLASLIMLFGGPAISGTINLNGSQCLALCCIGFCLSPVETSLVLIHCRGQMEEVQCSNM